MKKTTKPLFRALVLAAAALAVLVSCQKSPRIGSQVRFTASIVNEPETRTAYGEVSGNYQFIYWSAGDQISIYSGNPSVAATEADGSNAMYTLKVDSSNSTQATLLSTENLVWKGDGEVTFYGVYPYDTPAGSTPGQFTMTLPADQSSTFGETTLSKGYMVAKTAFSKTTENVVMSFYPVFSAFEIHLKNGEDTTIPLTRIALKTTNTAYDLAGSYQTDWTSTDRAYTITSGGGQEVFVDFPSGTTITDTQEQVVTLFLTPFEYTGLDLELTFQKPGDTHEITRKLALKQGGNYITFAPCKKHQITGVALDGADTWLLEVNGSVLPWSGVEYTIMEEVSISGKVNITGAIETTTAWKTSSVGNAKSNHYADSAWEEGGNTGYDKNYQLRTLNKDLPVAQRYFTMTFTPTAPTGGYWQLIPQYRDGDTQSPRHFRFERDVPGGGTSEQLSGQILNQQETIRIYPVDWDPSDVNTYDVWFTSRFSTSPTFAHTINADSEFQDVHGDGRFSYWVFHIAQYNGVYLDE